MGNTKIRKGPAAEIDRKAARVAEESYFERLSANANATAGIYDPLTNRTYDASPRNRITKVLDERSSDVKALIKRFAERDLMRTYEEMPKNGVVLHEIDRKAARVAEESYFERLSANANAKAEIGRASCRERV